MSIVYTIIQYNEYMSTLYSVHYTVYTIQHNVYIYTCVRNIHSSEGIYVRPTVIKPIFPSQ